MTEQTHEEKEMAIKVLSFALWGAVVVFVVMAGLFLFDIIPSSNGGLIGGGLLAFAVLDSLFIKFFIGKMEADLDK